MNSPRYVRPDDPSLRLPEPETVFYVGLDLGQSNDYTAVSIVRTLYLDDGTKPRHELVHLERLPLGTSYTSQAAAVVELCRRPELGVGWRLVVDATGVGRAVVDLLREGLGAAREHMVAVTITGAGTAMWNRKGISCPKGELVHTLLVLLEGHRLVLAEGLPELETFVREAANFQVKLTAAGHDTYGVSRLPGFSGGSFV